MRAILLTCAIALAAAAPLSVAHAGKYNLCKAKTSSGKMTTFKCKADEKCCYAKLTDKASCIPASAICL